MKVARPICRRLFKQEVCLDFSFAADNAGRSRPARIAIIAMTTSSSIKVKPQRGREGAARENGSAPGLGVFTPRSPMKGWRRALFELIMGESVFIRYILSG